MAAGTIPKEASPSEPICKPEAESNLGFQAAKPTFYCNPLFFLGILCFSQPTPTVLYLFPTTGGPRMFMRRTPARGFIQK
ncbi:MAG: hypothetical protein Q9172_001727 [Xanthocarpia lactea]